MASSPRRRRETPHFLGAARGAGFQKRPRDGTPFRRPATDWEGGRQAWLIRLSHQKRVIYLRYCPLETVATDETDVLDPSRGRRDLSRGNRQQISEFSKAAGSQGND